MRSLLAVFVLAVFPLWTAAQDKKPNYYPFVKGNKWEFTVEAGGKSIGATTEVAKVEEKDGTLTATLEIRVVGMDSVSTETISTNSKGMTRQAFAGLKLDTPITMMKFPVKGGDSWTEKVTVNGNALEIKATVSEAVEVKVPAGTYKAVPVNMEINVGGQKLTMTNWYADGVGVVKQQIDTTGVKAVGELKKFTLAK